ncbi:hypothetical protein ACRAWD_00800 [Caulobacter segnis]
MPETYLRKGDYGFDSGAAAAEALLSRWTSRRRRSSPPTTSMAAAVAKVARERGVHSRPAVARRLRRQRHRPR